MEVIMYYFGMNEAKQAISKTGNVLRLMANSDTMMAMHATLGKGKEFLPHSHPHEQITVVLKGSLEYIIGGEVMIMKAGDTCLAPPDVVHSAKALEDGTEEIEIFTPKRDDLYKLFD